MGNDHASEDAKAQTSTEEQLQANAPSIFKEETARNRARYMKLIRFTSSTTKAAAIMLIWSFLLLLQTPEPTRAF